MKKIIFSALFSTILFLGASAHALAAPYNQPGNWSLVFADEFSTTLLDSSKWDNGYAGWTIDLNMGNASLTNILLDGQSLHLKYSGTASNFTVGALTTKSTFNSGYFEARMKLGKGNGIWPALWAYSGAVSPNREVDIMEYLGNTPNSYYSTIHNGSNTTQRQYLGSTDLSADYHIYAGQITPTEVIMYFDGVEFWRTARTDMNVPFRLTVNQGIMCNGVIWDSNACDATTFNLGAETLVDWVRIWTPAAVSPTITSASAVATAYTGYYKLSVSAKSLVPKANLSVSGFGSLKYNRTTDTYSALFKSTGSVPNAVTIVSSAGSSLLVPVTVR